ncbi:MAG: methyltransferase domain-containing protein [Thermoguttaceae bacterium]
MFGNNVTTIIKRPVKKCLQMIAQARELMQPARAGGPARVPFLCNVCGTANMLPQARLTREDGHCSSCQCYGRLRSMVYALTSQFSPQQPVLKWMAARKDIRGLGCSDWGYTGLLAKKFDYVNAFYDREPQLDLCNVDWRRWDPASFDFITCTDVLEHVEPPVQRAFDNMHRLLKPGGVAILTVPTTLDPINREHFPALTEWSIETQNSQRVLINRRDDGVVERFDNLCWHGGEGMTLEFRVFSREGLIDNVEKAGLRVAQILDRSIPRFAVSLCPNNLVLLAEKPASAVLRQQTSTSDAPGKGPG